MADLASLSGIAQDQSFRDRVMAAMALKARAVATAPRAEGDEFPRQYAVAIIRNPANYANLASWVLATDPAISATGAVAGITDEMIVAAVARSWLALAGLS